MNDPTDEEQVVEGAQEDPDAPAIDQLLDPEGSARLAPAAIHAEKLELYKLAVEMADRVSSRRTNANSFFLALHAAFASMVTFLGLQIPAGRGEHTITETELLNTTIVVGAGLFLCLSWYLILRSYRDLNRAKFKVINGLEHDLAVSVFSDEWRYLKDDVVSGWRGRYREQGTVERLVPVLFAILYVIAELSAMSR